MGSKLKLSTILQYNLEELEAQKLKEYYFHLIKGQSSINKSSFFLFRLINNTTAMLGQHIRVRMSKLTDKSRHIKDNLLKSEYQVQHTKACV